MTQGEIDASLNKHKHLLDGSWQSAASVAQRVAWDLRRAYALIRKDGGTRCGGPGGVSIDCDKLINRTTFDVYDTVISAGTANNAVGWLHEGRHPDLSGRLVEPVDYAGSGGNTGGGGGQQPAPACKFVATDLSTVQANIATIGDRLDSIEDAVLTAERRPCRRGRWCRRW